MDRKKLKGFTLIELIVVIAIITVLSGILSLAINGFRRDARIETNNKKAQMVYTAFQDILIDMEVSQDTSMLDVRGELADPSISVKGAILFFRISDMSSQGHAYTQGSSGLGDEIHIMTAYSGNVPNGGIGGQGNVASGSVWIDLNAPENVSGYAGYNNYSKDKNGNDDGGATLWNKWNTAVAGRIDPSMAGSYCVMMDVENYEVKSVICRELVGGRDPKTGLYDPSECTPSGAKPLNNYVGGSNPAIMEVDPGGTPSVPCRMYFVKNMQAQIDAARNDGVYMGCYPFYNNIT